MAKKKSGAGNSGIAGSSKTATIDVPRGFLDNFIALKLSLSQNQMRIIGSIEGRDVIFAVSEKEKNNPDVRNLSVNSKNSKRVAL